MAYLDGVKVGDKLWSIQLGECEVISVDVYEEYSIMVVPLFSDVDPEYYTMDGYYIIDHKFPNLFWSKPEFELPPRPKRMVKKEGWINIFQDGSVSKIEQSKEDAYHKYFSDWRIACIKIEYEVEE